jgi:hypothetical protein
LSDFLKKRGFKKGLINKNTGTTDFLMIMSISQSIVILKEMRFILPKNKKIMSTLKIYSHSNCLSGCISSINRAYLLAIILFAGAILFFASCGNSKHQPNSAAEYCIDIDIDKKKMLGCDKFSSPSYILLETTEQSIIGTINKLYFADSLIVIFDGKQMNILVFDMQGRYVRHIGERGNASDEYLYWNDVFFDKILNKIYAYERYQDKMYIYDLSGKLIGKSEQSKYSFDAFCRAENGYWVYSCYKANNPDGYSLMLLDESLQTIKSAYFPQKEFFAGEFLASRFSVDESNTPYFFFPMSNIIYQLSGVEAIPYIEVNFGDKTMPYKQLTEIADSKAYEKLIADKKYLGDIANFTISKHNVYFSFKESGYNILVNSYYCLFHTGTKENFLYANPFIEKCRYPIRADVKQMLNNKLVFVLEPSVFSENSFLVLQKEFSDSSIDAESNPILCLFEFLE